MIAPAFTPHAAPGLWRASATKIAVERIAERSATLKWTGPSKAVYTVFYAPKGDKFRSRRTVAHPNVSLRSLSPGLLYNIHVTGPTFDYTTSFTTVATAAKADPSVANDLPEAPLTELSRLEIRVGKVVECEKHPDADSLYVEKVDVGEEHPRTIVSGLVKYVPLEQMLGRSVVVLCNLKPRAMRGVTSQGMLLCVSNEDHTVVDPLSPPTNAPLGELITFEGHKAAPIDPGNRATKAFDRIAEGLKTNDQGVAMYEQAFFSTSVGPCVSPAKLEGSIS